MSGVWSPLPQWTGCKACTGGRDKPHVHVAVIDMFLPHCGIHNSLEMTMTSSCTPSLTFVQPLRTSEATKPVSADSAAMAFKRALKSPEQLTHPPVASSLLRRSCAAFPAVAAGAACPQSALLAQLKPISPPPLLQNEGRRGSVLHACTALCLPC